MEELTQNHLKVDIVNYDLDAAEEDSSENDLDMASDYMWSQRKRCKFDVRMKATIHGHLCGEKLIKNNCIHDTQGHTIFIQNNIKDPKPDVHFPDIEKGRSILNKPSELYDPTLIGTMEVTFEEIRDVQYHSTLKMQTHERRERMASMAERTMGSKAQEYRIPLERLVDCGYGSMSWDYVHEDRHAFATFQFKSCTLGEASGFEK